jgi:hypothetical protein
MAAPMTSNRQTTRVIEKPEPADGWLSDLILVDEILTEWRQAAPEAKQQALAILRAAVKQEDQQ